MAMPKDILEAVEELIYVVDMENYDLLYANDAMRKAFGITRADLKGRKCYEIISSFSSPCDFCTNDKLCPGKFYTWTVHNKNLGRVYKVSDTIINYEGRPARLEIASDISDYLNLREAKREDRAVNKLYRNFINLLTTTPTRFEGTLNLALNMLMRVLKGNRVNLIIYNAKGEYEIFAQTTGKGAVLIDEKFVHGTQDYLKAHDEMMFGRQDKFIDNPLEDAHQHPLVHKFLIRNKVKSIYLHPVFFENERLGFLMVDNADKLEVTHLREKLHNLMSILGGALWQQVKNSSLERAVYVDSRTNLYNRTCFMRDWSANDNKSVNLGLIVVDVNGLKVINDKDGHAKGDELLKKTASVLVDLYGCNNCYSFGDDEFVVAFANVSQKTFDDAIFTIKSLFAGGLGFTASVGGMLGSSDDLTHIIAEATNRMLSQKQEFYTKNPQGPRYRTSSDLVLQRLSQPHTVRMLIQRGDFMPYIQPIYDKDGKLAKGEALVRLNYKGTIVPPIKFIPLLESMNMTADIDFYIFRKSCEIIKERQKQGLPVVPLATNFSRYTVTAPDFVKRVEDIVFEVGVNPSLLFLEVTESIEEREHKTLVDVTKELLDKGFQVAVDDFGVANANILTFVNLSMNTLKFDKKITDALQVGNKAYLTVKFFLDLVHQQGVDAVAEGVETKEQVELLKDLGFDFLQGYFFSKPVPVAQFIELCNNQDLSSSLIKK